MLPGLGGLNNHHRDTLAKLFQHPTSHNIDWPDVVSLLNAVGTVMEHRGGEIEVCIGADVRYLERPRHKDINIQQVVELRHLLSAAEFRPGGEPLSTSDS